jgi:uncharacterized protein
MEEILASIRRIISEEGGTTGSAARPGSASPEKDEVLELTDVVGEDGLVAKLEKVTPVEPEHSAPEGGGLLSERAATAAAESIAELATLVAREQPVRDNPALGGGLPLGGAGRTLEDVVRELLRPLLRDWLDQNLPGLVDRLVRDEIEKLVRRTQGR